MITRRSLLTASSSLLISSGFPNLVFASDSTGNKLMSGKLIKSALEKTDLIYLTPLRADGKESQCQAEVWFVAVDSAAYVVTAADTWRARAAQQGLNKTRIWAGDVGVWTKSKGKYRDLPSYPANSSLITDPLEHKRILEIFGAKYSLEWVIWGPRFRNGLEKGSRVMLKYAPSLSSV